MLARGLEKNPKVSLLYQYLADIEIERGNPNGPKTCLIRGVQALPEDRDLKWLLAEVRIERLAARADDKALVKLISDQIKELISLNYPRQLVGYLQAHARYAKGIGVKRPGGPPKSPDSRPSSRS